jgi:hypothetical protein
VCEQTEYMADDVDDPTSDRFLEVYVLWMFGWVMFCESAGDYMSWYMIPWAQRIADAPLEPMPQISWGNAVLAATYRGLCLVVTRLTSRETILLGCPLLLQMLQTCHRRPWRHRLPPARMLQARRRRLWRHRLPTN